MTPHTPSLSPKEEMKRKFEVWFENTDHTIEYINSRTRKAIFDFFYQEIEAREKEIKTLTSENNDLACKNEDMENIDSEQVRELKAKLSQQESLLKAADEVISASKGLGNYAVHGDIVSAYKEALQRYSDLKSKD